MGVECDSCYQSRIACAFVPGGWRAGLAYLCLPQIRSSGRPLKLLAITESVAWAGQLWTTNQLRQAALDRFGRPLDRGSRLAPLACGPILASSHGERTTGSAFRIGGCCLGGWGLVQRGGRRGRTHPEHPETQEKSRSGVPHESLDEAQPETKARQKRVPLDLLAEAISAAGRWNEGSHGFWAGVLQGKGWGNRECYAAGPAMGFCLGSGADASSMSVGCGQSRQE
jgi:hypothetical protein